MGAGIHSIKCLAVWPEGGGVSAGVIYLCASVNQKSGSDLFHLFPRSRFPGNHERRAISRQRARSLVVSVVYVSF